MKVTPDMFHTLFKAVHPIPPEITAVSNSSLYKYPARNLELFKISKYIGDGFEKICEVIPTVNRKWFYKNINKKLMFSDHRSWVYFITINDEIVKCGETGNPLGIPQQYQASARELNGVVIIETQPIAGSKSRFGRLANAINTKGRTGDTDVVLREEITPLMLQGSKVELWARKCPIVESTPLMFLGKPVRESTTIHKSLEVSYLEHFKAAAGCLPLFNKSTK